MSFNDENASRPAKPLTLAEWKKAIDEIDAKHKRARELAEQADKALDDAEAQILELFQTPDADQTPVNYDRDTRISPDVFGHLLDDEDYYDSCNCQSCVETRARIARRAAEETATRLKKEAEASKPSRSAFADPALIGGSWSFNYDCDCSRCSGYRAKMEAEAKARAEKRRAETEASRLRLIGGTGTERRSGPTPPSAYENYCNCSVCEKRRDERKAEAERNRQAERILVDALDKIGTLSGPNVWFISASQSLQIYTTASDALRQYRATKGGN